MIARRMGKTRVIAETGAGQHGVATATACALFGLECTVYMGEEDIRRQKLNVFNMRTMGANGRARHLGSRTLRDATNEAMRDWMGSSKRDALHDRQRGRPAPLPDDRPRLPGGHRPETRAPVPRPARAGCPTCRGRLRRRRLERGGDVLSVHRGRVGRIDRGRGGRSKGRPRASMRRASRRVARASSTAVSATSSRTTTARPTTSTRSPPGSTTRASAPSTATGRTPGGSDTRAITDAEALEAYNVTARNVKGSCPPSSRATRWPRRSRRPPRLGRRARRSSSASPAGGQGRLRGRPASDGEPMES